MARSSFWQNRVVDLLKVFVGMAAALSMFSSLLQIQQASFVAEIPPYIPFISGSSDKKSYGNYTHYIPAHTEDYLLKNSKALGFDSEKDPPGCTIWKDPNHTLYEDLHQLANSLTKYHKLLRKFKPISDLRKRLDPERTVCNTVELHPDGLPGIFQSGQLSYTRSGLVEPLLTPMRHSAFCWESLSLEDLRYLVHDFGSMCRHQLQKTSRIVMLDMGASLSFAANWNEGGKVPPPIHLYHLYAKFGFPFDHIYAFEVTPSDPARVYQLIPEEFMAAYHWINVGVKTDPNDRLNPLKMILDQYNEDDLIVVKLDIDTPALELPLAHQLLTDTRYHKLVDHFYFEHHVHMKEIAPWWGHSGMDGTVQDTLELFHGLRQKGIASHFWI